MNPILAGLKRCLLAAAMALGAGRPVAAGGLTGGVAGCAAGGAGVAATVAPEGRLPFHGKPPVRYAQ